MNFGASSKPSEAVLKALAILESFGPERPTQSLAEISRRLEIPKASALRHLAALEQSGYIARLDASTYVLGARVLELGRSYLAQNELLSSARPILDALAAETGETAHLAVLQGTQIIYVAIAESPQRVRAYVQQGDSLPAHVVASGKAILAHAGEAVVGRVIEAGLGRLSEHSIVSPEALLADLAETRRRGYGLNLKEWMEEVSATSAPVFAHDGSVVAAMGVAGPSSRLNAGNIHEIGAIVRDHAERLSRLLGAPSRAA